MTQYLKITLSIILLCIGLSPFARAEVRLPNGEYYLNVTDLRVKVLGGYVSVQRTWRDQQWHHNRAWNNLQLEYDSLNGSVKSIDHNGDIYKKFGGNAVTNQPANITFTFGERLRIVQSKIGFRWQNIEGDWVEYDTTGRISRYGNQNNIKVGFIYNTEGQRVGVTDHHDTQVLWYTYTTDGTVMFVRDHVDSAQARSVSYTYINKKITTVTDVRGNSVGYTYANNRLTEIADQENRVTKITYDLNGRVITVTALDKTVTQYKYSFDKNKREYYSEARAPNGKATETWYDKAGEAIRRVINGTVVETIAKDKYDHLHMDGLGNQTRREYDASRNLTRIIYADGTQKISEYDSHGNLLIETNENGVRTKNEYNSNGMLTRKLEAYRLDEQRITEYTYDEFGQLIKYSRLGDGVTQRADTLYTYDANGNKTSETDPEGNVTTYVSYDTAGNLLEWRDGRNKVWKASYDKAENRLSRTNPLGYSVNYTYNKTNQRLTQTDEMGEVTVFAYDDGGRLVTTTDPLDGVTSLRYNARGQLIALVDAENKVTRLSYDSRGRLRNRTDGNDNVTSWQYLDAVSDDLLSVTDYPTYRQEYRYSPRLRRTAITDKRSDTQLDITRTAYDGMGNRILMTDAKGRMIMATYDGLNRLIQQTDPTGGLVRYVYDNRDNLISVINENSVQLRRFSYDRNDQKIEKFWPSNAVMTTVYDEDGRVVKRTDAKGQVATLTYDDVGRLETVIHRDKVGGTIGDNITITFDKRNALTGYANNDVNVRISRDVLGRKISEVVNYGVFSKIYQYDYFRNGRKKSFTPPEGKVVLYSYDTADNLSTISLPDKSTITYGRYLWTRPQLVTYPGGIQRVTRFDVFQQPKQITVKDVADNTVMDRQYTYDAVNNITQQRTEHGDYQYYYDELDRLISSDNAQLSDEAYTYAPTGNRITSQTSTKPWQYDSNNLLLSRGGISYSYDANGSRTSQTESGVITTYVYNLKNRLSEVRQGSTSIAQYRYNPLGQRISKRVSGVTTYYLYNDEGLIGEYDGSGTLIQAYGYEPEGLWRAAPVYTHTGQTMAYYHLDHLGTPQKLVDSRGKTVWSSQQQAFGDMQLAVSDVTNNLRFLGQYYDQETGLHYGGNRYYDPRIGRYITSDPIGFDGGLNSFGYSLNNPVNFYDPNGLEP